MNERPTYTVKVTDQKTGTVTYLKYPHPLTPDSAERLGRFLAQIARHNPDFSPEKVAEIAVDRLNQGQHYHDRPIRIDAAPWDMEVAYHEGSEDVTPRRLTFHTRCLADCVTAITFTHDVTLEEAMAYAKAHMDELDTFYPPRIIKCLEIVEGSGCLEDDCPPNSQVVCVDGTFTASAHTAQCVKFSRRLSDEQADLFRSCLKKASVARIGGNREVVAQAVKMFNTLASEYGWDVTAELLNTLEPWERVMDYDAYDVEGGEPTCRIGTA